MPILVIAEHDNKKLKESTFNTLTAACKLVGDVHILVAGLDCMAPAQEAAQLRGVAKVLVVDDRRYGEQCAENISALIVANAASYSHIFAPATTFGKNFLPRVAALLDVAQISDIISIEGSSTFLRPIYAGNALARVESVDVVKVITVRVTAFEATPYGNNVAAIEMILPAADVSRTVMIDRKLTISSRPELGAAKIIVAGGRGLGSKENYHSIIGSLANKLGAAMGASRAAVDAGFVSNDYQIGQTGKIVAPNLYIAIGISGAIQHLAGMSGSKIIVAINKDPFAPIFQIADYSLVADLFDAVPKLTEMM
jgi:electron transfer flavoprotein alpha subunit